MKTKILETTVERNKPYFEKDMLKKHVEAIGKRIIDDAENLFNLTERGTRSIFIKANIEADEVTTVTYEIKRFADPRLKFDAERVRKLQTSDVSDVTDVSEGDLP